jgi:hypothetical protein
VAAAAASRARQGGGEGERSMERERKKSLMNLLKTFLSLPFFFRSSKKKERHLSTLLLPTEGAASVCILHTSEQELIASLLKSRARTERSGRGRAPRLSGERKKKRKASPSKKGGPTTDDFF